MKTKMEREASLVEKNLAIQIDALSVIKATMPTIMVSSFYNSDSLLHQNYLVAMHDLQTSVMRLQRLTNDVCEEVITKSSERRINCF